MNEIHCIITGLVQLVMFRDFAQRKARSLGLLGTVRNLPDGTVEVVAQGNREKLEILIERLHNGPLFARVDDVRVTWRKPKVVFEDFHIVF